MDKYMPPGTKAICLKCKKWICKSTSFNTPICVRNKKIRHFDFEFNSQFFDCQNWCLCDFKIAKIERRLPRQEETYLAKVPVKNLKIAKMNININTNKKNG